MQGRSSCPAAFILIIHVGTHFGLRAVFDGQDAIADAETAGKNVGIDASLERPSAVRELGLDGAITRLHQCVEHSLDVIPHCPGRDVLLEVVQFASARFFPKGLRKTAA